MVSDPLTIIHGDCVEVMRGMDEASVDAIVTDPPYGLEFMGKEWDRFTHRRLWRAKGYQWKGKQGLDNLPAYMDKSMLPAFQAWTEAWAREAIRVLKPGGYLLAFGGTRTFHRMTCAIEDAGFEIRDCLMWLYGSGFPKSLDVSKAMDRAAGAEREVVRTEDRRSEYDGRERTSLAVNTNWRGDDEGRDDVRDVATRTITSPTTELAKKWKGWGTALKPAWEPIILARKPLIGTVVENVTKHGTGALNIDGTRVGRANNDRTEYGRDRELPHANTTKSLGKFEKVTPYSPATGGRWPANVLLDEESAAMLDEQTGVEPRGDSGGPSRFFYTAKASRKERGAGNTHPTVKPTKLMRYLVRLVTPPGGLVLDPFAGSGTTGLASREDGFHVTLIEREAEYVAIMRARLGGMTSEAPLPAPAKCERCGGRGGTGSPPTTDVWLICQVCHGSGRAPAKEGA